MEEGSRIEGLGSHGRHIVTQLLPAIVAITLLCVFVVPSLCNELFSD